MKKSFQALFSAAVLFLAFPVCALTQERMETRQLDSIRITADRVLKDMGIQKTVIDTLALRESISGSLASVLTQNSTLFIKSYGRATLSTASFRGTAPSHTQVTWNGMRLNSPMLGMVDFSQIPSYFIDDANIYHGASSVQVSGGGLGGAVTLSTRPAYAEGFNTEFVQGAGSFGTFDEYLRLNCGSSRWKSSTRIAFSTSKNDYRYVNYRKKNIFYDPQGNVTGFEYPVEQNKNGEFRDLHVLQEACLTSRGGSQWEISAWYMNSTRGVPLLNVDYKENNSVKSTQLENTIRTVTSWQKLLEQLKLAARAGYTYTDMLYLYRRGLGNGEWADMVHSQSFVNTLFAQADMEYYLKGKWMFTGNLSVYQHFVTSMDRAVVSVSGQQAIAGYEQARMEISGFLAVKYRATDRLGLALNLREDLYGRELAPLIPSFFADYLLSKKGNVTLKASVARNFRYPTLNDLYFMPGGNPLLKPEQGFTYDGGVSFAIGRDYLRANGEVTFFNSRINNWIVWLPTFKGFWSPLNVKQVHSYGMEAKAWAHLLPGKEWNLILDGHFAWTRSINLGDPVDWSDQAIGKQLVYIPEFSGAITGRLRWKNWEFVYKWCYYSERYTTSSNNTNTRLGVLGPYFMNDMALERKWYFKRANLSVKGTVNNLFDEEYETVLSRPMPGINFELYLGITPKFSSTRK